MMRHSFLTRACAALFVVAALSAVPASAQVVFDAASNASPATTGVGTPINVSWNHTVGLAKKPYIVVSVGIKLNGAASAGVVSSVTYGSEAGGPGTVNGNGVMTLLGVATNGTIARAEVWGFANPTPGTHQITVNVTH